MNHRMDGKVALVTGAASGIGLATVRRLVADGAHVVAGDIDADALDRLDDEWGATSGDVVSTLVCDVTAEADVASLAERCVSRFGRLDIAVANAGIGEFGLLVDAAHTRRYPDPPTGDRYLTTIGDSRPGATR